jgi:hypothetical protein
MLVFLQGQASDRKLRLFGVACCRRIWRLLSDEHSRAAVEVEERAADGAATEAELAAASEMANAVSDEAADAVSEADGIYSADPTAENARAFDLAETVRTAADTVCELVAGVERIPHLAFAAAVAVACEAEMALCGLPNVDHDQVRFAHDAAMKAESSAQADLMRDIFNPFHPHPPRRGKKKWQAQWHSLLAWEGGTVPKLARAIYEERAFDRLPVLADALLEAGCSDADLLSHCRQPGEHVLGCWAVDRILARG